jgi:hypothetical protein
VHEGPSAYSNLVSVSADKLGLLYEGGVKSAYEGIAWKEIDVPTAKPGKGKKQKK